MRVRILSENELEEVEDGEGDSDGDDGGGEPAPRWLWRWSPANLQQMFSRAFVRLAEAQPRRGLEVAATSGASADELGGAMARGLEEMLRRAVAQTAEAGTHVVTAEIAREAIEDVASELGLPPPRRQRRS